MKWQRIVLVSLGVAVAHVAKAQSFNIDLDVGAGSEAVGNGAPSSAFGAAANQPGFWNRLNAANHSHAELLFDLTGNVTTATIWRNVSGGGAGSGMGNNTGDFRLLLNDRTMISVPTTFRFENLLPGRYRIYTYGIDPNRTFLPLKVEVPYAGNPVQFSGQGPMPGDRFELGVTHCIHEVDVLGSSFSMTLSGLSVDPPDPSANGFQLVYTPVPEPSTIFGVLFVAGVLIRKRL